MNRFGKIFFLITFVIFFVGIISPIFVFAAEQPETTISFCPQIDIPGIKMFNTKDYPCKTKDAEGNYTDAFKINKSSIADLAAGTYKFIAGIAGIAAVIVMMAGGYIWLFAGGNASKVGEAKSLLGSAVLGLALVLGSYMILNLINPELIKLKSLDDIAGITKIKIATASKICTKPERDKFAQEKGIKMADQQTCGQVYIEKDCINISCPYLSNSICLLMVDSKGQYSGKGCSNSISAPYATTLNGLGPNAISKTFKVTGHLSDANANKCGVVTLLDDTYGDRVGGFCGPVSDYKDNTCYLISSGNRIEDGPAAIKDESGSGIKMYSQIPGKVYSNGKGADVFQLMGCGG